MNPDSEAGRRRLARLAAGIAHDLNNLLTAITGRLDLLLSELPARSPVRADLEEVRRDARAIGRVVGWLVEFSGQAPSRRRSTPVAELLGGLEERVIERRSGEVRVVSVREAGAGPTEVDPDQVRRVLEALVDNALEAMPGGGVLLLRTSSVEMSPSDRTPGTGLERGRYVRVEVADNGPGMPGEVLERVFEPYFSTKSRGAGRGLQLAAAPEILRQNGGTIRIESEPGRGTRAIVFLPVVRARQVSPRA